MAKKFLVNRNETNGGTQSSTHSDFMAAGAGGIMASFFTTPVELIMIQQQKYGGTFFGTLTTVGRTHGVLNKGLMRGLVGAASRDAIYVSGMLAVTPLLREHLINDFGTPATQAGLYSSLIGGVMAAVPSHPFDVIKTCMQVIK